MNPTRCCWQIFFGHLLLYIIIIIINKKTLEAQTYLYIKVNFRKAQTTWSPKAECARPIMRHPRLHESGWNTSEVWPPTLLSICSLCLNLTLYRILIPNPQSPPSSKNLACLLACLLAQPDPTRSSLSLYVYGFLFSTVNNNTLVSLGSILVAGISKMGKNQAYKAMQRARLGSSSAGPDEVEDGMVCTLPYYRTSYFNFRNKTPLYLYDCF